MKHFFRSTFLVLSLLLFAATVSAAPAKVGKAKNASSGTANAVNFQRTQKRIDALLGPRLKPTPLPETLPNPFQLAMADPPPSTHEKDPKPVVEALAPDSEMLLYYGASLKISGTVRINDQTHLIINQAPYREGDLFTLKTKDATVKLRIVRIAPGELTLGLNDAVQVIKFKK